MHVSVVDGDLLAQPVDAIVCPRARTPHTRHRGSVAAAVRRRAGRLPFADASRRGPLVPGSVVMTGAGDLPHRAILHAVTVGRVAFAFENSLRESVRNVLVLAQRHGMRSVAMPLLGAGAGRRRRAFVLSVMRDELAGQSFDGEVRIVIRPGPRWRWLRRQACLALPELIAWYVAFNLLMVHGATIVQRLHLQVEVLDAATGRPIANARVSQPQHVSDAVTDDDGNATWTWAGAARTAWAFPLLGEHALQHLSLAVAADGYTTRVVDVAAELGTVSLRTSEVRLHVRLAPD